MQATLGEEARQMKQTKSGFTLIELLVVIAIIAILAAILFPVFATAREKARQTTCASNLKQLGLGLIQYSQDYDERCPYDEGTAGVDTKGAGWATQIYPYLKSKGVFTCPDDANAPNSGGSTIEFSYAMNLNVIGWNKTAAPCVNANTHACDAIGGALTKLTAPAATVYVFEAAFPGCSSDPSASFTGDCSNMALAGGGQQGATDIGTDFGAKIFISTGEFGGRTLGLAATGTSGASGLDPLFPTGRHSGGSNFLLCDGHVKWLLPTNVSTGQNPGNGGEAPSPSTCAQDTCGRGTGNYNATGTAALASPVVATFSTY